MNDRRRDWPYIGLLLASGLYYGAAVLAWLLGGR